jgi:hypothetical protein
MNFVAGCLLMFMDEEEAFYCLGVLVGELLAGYYDPEMVSAQVGEGGGGGGDTQGPP